MESIKIQIIKYLEEDGGYVFGGVIDDFIRDQNGSKTSNVSRRCRELENAGVIEKDLVQIEGKGPRCVRYRVVDSFLQSNML
jgi:DNA-binding Lrp family transcriptional regulator